MDRQKLAPPLFLRLFAHTLVIISTTRAQNMSFGPEVVEEWFKTLPHIEEKLTKLHFYFHDTVKGKNQSSITVAKSDANVSFPNGFGIINVIDDPLTDDPEPNSTVVGYAQGVFSSTSIGEFGLLMVMNFVFTNEMYNGSTLSVLGHNPALHKYREMPIVGGSGVFRLARGIATAKTVWLNLNSLNAVVEYNVVILHY